MKKKQDLVEIIAKQQEITKKEANKIIDAFTNGIREILANKESVSLAGFGKFVTEHKAEAQRVLGFTGELVTIPAHYVYKAKLSKAIVK